MKRRAGSARLKTELRASQNQIQLAGAPEFPGEMLELLQGFQRSRLRETYNDIASQERYRLAVGFFLNDLYGGGDVRERDRQVEKVLPIMERMLPLELQRSLADAFELQAMSLSLDMKMARALHDEQVSEVDEQNYQGAYADIAREQRIRQIDLIHELAMTLDRAINRPLVPGLVTAMRAPAQAAGFGALQSFLERGLKAFRRMGGAEEFALMIRDRETQIMQQLYAGGPHPFRL